MAGLPKPKTERQKRMDAETEARKAAGAPPYLKRDGFEKLRSFDKRYKIEMDGCDALLTFGKHDGKTLKQVVKADRGYLKWIADPKNSFPEELRDVSVYVQKWWKVERKKGLRKG